MKTVRRHLFVLALAALLLPVSDVPLGAMRACATGPHSHDGAMPADCFMHHQSSEQQQITCGCFNDPAGMVAGAAAVLPADQAMAPASPGARPVPGPDGHAPDVAPDPTSPRPR